MEKNEMIIVVTRAQAGDNEALSTLFNEYYNSVYYFALKTVKNEHIAADITQETFVQAITYLGTLRDPSLFGSWLRSITYSRCTRYFSKDREMLLDEENEGFFEDIREDKAEYIPDEALDKAEFRRTVMNIIDELSDEQRSAVLMYYFDELSVKQIAAIQGVSEGTVKSRLNYARKYIKASVEDYEQKHGIKLYAALLPILYWIFSSEIAAIPAELAATAAPSVAAATGVGLKVTGTSQVAAATGTGVQGSVSDTVTKDVSRDAAKRAAKSSANGVEKAVTSKVTKDGVKAVGKGVAETAVKKAGLSLGAKIAAGVVAGIIVIGAVAGGAVALVKRNENKNNEPETEQTEKLDIVDTSVINDGGEENIESDNIFAVAEVGDYVYFGSYEQDNDTSNGTEAIEWLVLTKEENRALVVSKYALDCKPYNEIKTSVRWQDSTLRVWLNNEFYNSAFSADERGRILLSDNENLGTAVGISGGDNTEDRVFLLSVDELSYFGDAENRACSVTDYAVAHGAIKHESSGNCMWWLRSIGYSPMYGSYIKYGGALNTTGSEVDDDYLCVRPAMWVSLSEESEPAADSVSDDETEEIIISDEDREAQIAKYNAFLTGGGYDEILSRTDADEWNFEIVQSDITSYLADLDNDGIYEVLLKFNGIGHIYTYLDIVDDDVVHIQSAAYSGGMAGGDFLYIANDTENNTNVLIYDAHTREGSIRSHTINYVYDLTNRLEMLNYENYYYELLYAEENENEISSIKNETDLYEETENAFICYKIDGEYVSKQEYTSITERFEIIDDEELEMVPGTYRVPVYTEAAVQKLDEIELVYGSETVVFGSYEQDGDESNGAEPIEWLVLGKSGNKALVISKYILDNRQFHSSHDVGKPSWKDSDIRKWLNGDFYLTAFDDSERSRIQLVEVVNEDHPNYDNIKGGGNTEDILFLLSNTEAETYFTSDDARIAEYTEYSKTDNSVSREWWLRTPAGSQYVYSTGRVFTNMHVVTEEKGVRPAMWITLED